MFVPVGVPVGVPVAVVLVPLGAPVVTVVLPAMALLMMLATMPLAEADGMRMAARVVLALGFGAGGRDVSRPTGMPDGPVGTKLAGVVTASGSVVTGFGWVVTTAGCPVTTPLESVWDKKELKGFSCKRDC